MYADFETLSNVQNPCSLSNTSLYMLFFVWWWGFLFVCLFLCVCCFFLFHSWKLKKQVRILDGWCPSSTWHNPHIYLFKGEKVLTEWLASLPMIAANTSRWQSFHMSKQTRVYNSIHFLENDLKNRDAEEKIPPYSIPSLK